jgi:hypothetical protein
MLTAMKKKLNFVNIAGNAFNSIMDELIDWEYEITVSAAGHRYTSNLDYPMMVVGGNKSE